MRSERISQTFIAFAPLGPAPLKACLPNYARKGMTRYGTPLEARPSAVLLEILRSESAYCSRPEYSECRHLRAAEVG